MSEVTVTGSDYSSDTPRSTASTFSTPSDSPRSISSTSSTSSTSLTNDDALLVKLFSEIFNEMNDEEKNFYLTKFCSKLNNTTQNVLKERLMDPTSCGVKVLTNPFQNQFCTNGPVKKVEILPIYIAMIKDFEFPIFDPENPTLSLQKLQHLSLLIFRNVTITAGDCTFFADNVSFENFICTKTTITTKELKPDSKLKDASTATLTELRDALNEDGIRTTSQATLEELQDVLIKKGMLTRVLATQIRLGKIIKPESGTGYDIKYLKNRFAFKYGDATIIMTILKVTGTTYTTKFGLYIPENGTNYEWTSESDMRILHACGDNKISPSVCPFFKTETEGGRRRRSKLTKKARKTRKTRKIRKTRKTRKPRRRTSKKNKSTRK
jgi:hypothetical protein